MIAAKLALLALVLGVMVWVRLGRPGTERLSPRLRAWARWLPFLAGPALLVLVFWGWLRPAPPWGRRR